VSGAEGRRASGAEGRRANGAEGSRARDGERRGRWLLTAGALVGIALSAVGLLGSGEEPAGLGDAIAVVNGQPLPRDTFERFVAAVEAERRTSALPLSERQRLLDRLVDEELLLQHGIGLGLARHEPTARRMIVQSVIAAVTGAAEAREPEPAELREFHARHPERFVWPGRVELEAFSVGVSDGDEAAARARAGELAAALAAGRPAQELLTSWPEVSVPPLPGGPLPLETVRRYLGPTAALRAAELEPGVVSEPFRAASGYLVLRVLSRAADRVPPFEEVAEQVRAEWVREQGEQALARFLADLRAAADLRVADLEDPERAAP
jgi:hypothetical protein